MKEDVEIGDFVFQKLVMRVGELLGFELEESEERPPSNQMLVGPGDKKLFLSNTWGGPGRLHIAGRLPTKEGHTHSKVSITVALTSPPEKVASAIERRLMPGYLVELAEAKDNLQKQADRAAWTDSVLSKFEKPEDSKRGRESHHVWITRGELTCCVDINLEPDDVSLTLRNVSERLALKIVALVRSNVPL